VPGVRGLAALVALGSLAGGAVRSAGADTAAASIAVPALGTEGPASLYPSSIRTMAPGGPTQRGQISVLLNAVTHPCPEHLAVLLVRNNATGFLLMANAGGCRPLQGTTMRFTALGVPFPNDHLTTAPYSNLVNLGASNYGTVPTFPAPAPAGPYAAGLPPETSFIDADWDLYVIDTVSTMRGVIAGGWSIDYSTSPTFEATQSNVLVPDPGLFGLGSGPASSYPMSFDLNGVPRGVTVQDLRVEMTLNHTFPDDLRIVLQSPAGTAVVLMANAGGGTDIPAGTTLTFSSAGSSPVSNAGPITAGSYRPGGAYGGSIALPAPAPQPPYETGFAALEGQPARGAWRLWAYDDEGGNFGQIAQASLTITTQGAVSFTVDLPLTFTGDQPFVQFDGTVSNQTSEYSFTWRNVVNGEYYDAGTFTRQGGPGQHSAAVPVKQGTNVVTYYVRATNGNQLSGLRTITVDEFAYFLAEGATGGFFDTDITIANPTDTLAPLQVAFLTESGGTVQIAPPVTANALRQIHVDDHVPGAATSTTVRSTNATPLAVERTMAWDARGYGGHGGTAVAPALQWLFAEGSQGYFSTFVLLANDNDDAADVRLSFLLEGGGPVVHQVSVPGRARRTIYAGDLPALVNRSFGISVESTRPIIAERVMYLPGARLFEGGHGSAGVNRPSRTWFLAEGATGPFFECFVLLSNPNAIQATVTLTYLLPTGDTVTQNVVVPANGRTTINVETVDPRLANVPVSTTVVSNFEIVAERAMYWPDISVGWQEAHNSFGITETGLRWGIADGRIGGDRQHETYLLLANPNPVPAEISVRFLKPGLIVTRTYVLNPTSRRNILVSQDVPELGAGTFGADVRVLNYQPIAVEKALYWNADGVAWAAGTNVIATRLPPP
jgi:subtilisin-like proprotein convertase family protein